MGESPIMPSRKVYNVGGSTVVSLPPSVRQKAQIAEGMTVLVEEEDGRIIISEAEIRKAHRPNTGSD